MGKITAYRKTDNGYIRTTQKDFNSVKLNPIQIWGEWEKELENDSNYKKYKGAKYITSLMKYDNKQSKFIVGYKMNEKLANEIDNIIKVSGAKDEKIFTNILKDIKMARAIEVVIASVFAGEVDKEENNERINWEFDDKSITYKALYKKLISALIYKLYLKNHKIDNLVRPYVNFAIKGVRISNYEYAINGKNVDGFIVAIIPKDRENPIYTFFVAKSKDSYTIEVYHIQVLKKIFEKDLCSISENIRKNAKRGEEIYAVDYTFYGEYPNESEMQELYDLEDEGYNICFDD